MNKIKYPKTLHLPWSQGVNSDDRVMKDLSGFEGHPVVITEKMEGENTTMARGLGSNVFGEKLNIKFQKTIE